jgi:hypothetical protein
LYPALSRVPDRTTRLQRACALHLVASRPVHDPSAFAFGTHRSCRPSGLHNFLAVVEHHSWSFAEDRCGSHRPYVGPSRTSALRLPRFATRSTAQDFQHIPVSQTPFAANSRPLPPASRATRRSRCPEQPCSASLSAGFRRWTDLCSAAYSAVTYATDLSAATYLPASHSRPLLPVAPLAGAVSNSSFVPVSGNEDRSYLLRQDGACNSALSLRRMHRQARCVSARLCALPRSRF